MTFTAWWNDRWTAKQTASPVLPLPTCLQHRQPQTSPLCKSWSTAGSAYQNVNLRKPCFWTRPTWNALPNILKCSTDTLPTSRRHL